MGGDGLAKGESGKAKRDGNNTRLARVLWGGGATPVQIRQLSDRAGASPAPSRPRPAPPARSPVADGCRPCAGRQVQMAPQSPDPSAARVELCDKTTVADGPFLE